MPAPAGPAGEESVDTRFRIGARIDVDGAQRTPALLLAFPVAKRNTGRRARSRKRRSNPQSAQEPAVPSQAPVQSRPARRARGGEANVLGELKSVGERPQAPWHPLPLSELLILVGAIGTIVGLTRLSANATSSARATLLAGLAAVAIGTIEVTLREHLSGYRSHTIMLALLPVIALDVVLVLAVATVTPPMKVVLLLLDGALFAFLFKLLRARFLDARHERRLAGGR